MKIERRPLKEQDFLHDLSYNYYMIAIPSKIDGKIFSYSIYTRDKQSKLFPDSIIVLNNNLEFNYYKSTEMIKNHIEIIKKSIEEFSTLFNSFEDYSKEVEETVKLIDSRVLRNEMVFSKYEKDIIERVFISEKEFNNVTIDNFNEIYNDVIISASDLFDTEKYSLKIISNGRIKYPFTIDYALDGIIGRLNDEDIKWLNDAFGRLGKCLGFILSKFFEKFIEYYTVYKFCVNSNEDIVKTERKNEKNGET